MLPEKVRHAICDGNHGRGACCPRKIDSIDSIGDDTAKSCAKRLMCAKCRALQAQPRLNQNLIDSMRDGQGIRTGSIVISPIETAKQPNLEDWVNAR